MCWWSIGWYVGLSSFGGWFWPNLYQKDKVLRKTKTWGVDKIIEITREKVTKDLLLDFKYDYKVGKTYSNSLNDSQ